MAQHGVAIGIATCVAFIELFGIMMAFCLCNTISEEMRRQEQDYWQASAPGDVWDPLFCMFIYRLEHFHDDVFFLIFFLFHHNETQTSYIFNEWIIQMCRKEKTNKNSSVFFAAIFKLKRW